MDNLIGFDIDGVFVNDVVPKEWNDSLVKSMNEIRQYQKPLFNPCAVATAVGKHAVLITARPLQDRYVTRAWADRFQMTDATIFHPDTTDILDVESAALHKARVCTENNIEVFVESSPYQIQIMRRYYETVGFKGRVIDFENLIKITMIYTLDSALNNKLIQS